VINTEWEELESHNKSNQFIKEACTLMTGANYFS